MLKNPRILHLSAAAVNDSGAHSENYRVSEGKQLTADKWGLCIRKQLFELHCSD